LRQVALQSVAHGDQDDAKSLHRIEQRIASIDPARDFLNRFAGQCPGIIWKLHGDFFGSHEGLDKSFE